MQVIEGGAVEGRVAARLLHQWPAKYVVSRNRDLPGEGGRRRQVYRIDHGGESKSYVAISLENGRADGREDGKIQIHHFWTSLRRLLPFVCGGFCLESLADSGVCSSATQPKESSTRVTSKMNPFLRIGTAQTTLEEES